MTMTPLAPLVTTFFRNHLAVEKGVSKHTIASYSYAFKFLCRYVSDRLGKSPSALALEDLDAPMIRAYLEYLERDCSNTSRTRNLRLTAIRSFMKYVEYEVPSALEQTRQILAISNKRTEERLINHLTREEMNAVLDAPNPNTRSGIRDQAMLYLGFAAGLRASELVGLRVDDIELDGPYPSILVRGKGRSQRRLPLWKEAARALRAWLAVRGTVPTPELFLNARGEALTTSGFSYIMKKHARMANQQCPSLSKKDIAPHVLRHTCAMISLQATGDIRKVAMWLGHSSLKSTEIYLRADPTEKLNTIEKALPPDLRRGTFPVEDKLIAWLSGRKLSGVSPWADPTNSELASEDS
jgi:site-specific recombinase XerD